MAARIFRICCPLLASTSCPHSWNRVAQQEGVGVLKIHMLWEARVLMLYMEGGKGWSQVAPDAMRERQELGCLHCRWLCGWKGMEVLCMQLRDGQDGLPVLQGGIACMAGRGGSQAACTAHCWWGDELSMWPVWLGTGHLGHPHCVWGDGGELGCQHGVGRVLGAPHRWEVVLISWIWLLAGFDLWIVCCCPCPRAEESRNTQSLKVASETDKHVFAQSKSKRKASHLWWKG